MPGANAKVVSEVHDTFGDLIPYGDPNWYQSVRRTPSLLLIPLQLAAET